MLYIAATLPRILDFPGIAGRPFQYLDRLIQRYSIARRNIEYPAGNSVSIFVTGANGSSYSQANTCGSSVAIGKFCTITVVFTPTTSGTLAGMLNIVDNASGSPQTVTLTGIGYSTPAATPTFSPAAGTYTSAQTVTIADATAGTTIYYTNNGTAPTTSSTKYTGAIKVSATETLKAIAVATGYASSAVITAGYIITPPAATPSFSPAAGTYTSAQTVTIADTTTGATIYYTTNGATPTTNSIKYTGAIKVSTTEALEAIAVATGYSNSAVAKAAYTVTSPAATPRFSPADGTYAFAQTVTIAAATPGAIQKRQRTLPVCWLHIRAR
jgi:hypothetical protein